jgi:hypothetical protein
VTADYLTLSVTVELAADDVSFVSEISYDLEAWQSNTTLLSPTNNANGSENPVTVDKELYMPENHNSIDDQMSVSPGDLG